MRKKTIKHNIFVVLCLVCVLSATMVVPSYASGSNNLTNVQVTLVFENYDNESYTFNIEVDRTAYAVGCVYANNCIQLSTSSDLTAYDDYISFYTIPLVYYSTARVEAYTADDGGYGTFGYGQDDEEFWGITPDSVNHTLYVEITLHTDYIYNQTSYEQYGVYKYNEGQAHGINLVRNNPSNYNLYTHEQYDSAYQDGANSVKGLVGVTNVAFSGVYNVFNSLMNSVGVFGITLGGIVVTCLFIFVIYIIFKIVKG